MRQENNSATVRSFYYFPTANARIKKPKVKFQVHERVSIKTTPTYFAFIPLSLCHMK